MAAKPKQPYDQQDVRHGGQMDDDNLFELRWERSERDLLVPLRELYGLLPEFEKRLKQLLLSHWNKRPFELKSLDLKRDLNPDWFLSETVVGYVFYIDRFAGNLKGVLEHIDYLKSLGVTYVHFMPCLKPRPGDSDGGYSVMDYRSIDPKLGTMADFEHVAAELRRHGMDVCIDLVLNHTAKEHAWAESAKRATRLSRITTGCLTRMTIPQAYDKTLIEIFPDTAPGSFTYYSEVQEMGVDNVQ